MSKAGKSILKSKVAPASPIAGKEGMLTPSMDPTKAGPQDPERITAIDGHMKGDARPAASMTP